MPLTLTLPARLLNYLTGPLSLRCSCGSEPELCQPNPAEPALLVGTCPECLTVTIYRETGDDWTSAQAYELPDFDLGDPPAPFNPVRRHTS